MKLVSKYLIVLVILMCGCSYEKDCGWLYITVENSIEVERQWVCVSKSPNQEP